MIDLNVDVKLAIAEIERMKKDMTGEVASVVMADLADEIRQASEAAFSLEIHPGTYDPWAAPSESTLESRGRPGGFKTLLSRTGQLKRSLHAYSKQTGVRAKAWLELQGSADVVRRGFVHLYGVTQRKKRVHMYYKGRPRYRNRRRPLQTMPARGFVGLSKQIIGEFIGRIHRVIEGGT